MKTQDTLPCVFLLKKIMTAIGRMTDAHTVNAIPATAAPDTVSLGIVLDPGLDSFAAGCRGMVKTGIDINSAI